MNVSALLFLDMSIAECKLTRVILYYAFYSDSHLLDLLSEIQQMTGSGYDINLITVIHCELDTDKH